MRKLRKQSLSVGRYVRITEDDDSYIERYAIENRLTISDVLRQSILLHQKHTARRALLGDFV